MQPYFFPYIGYYQLLHAVDVFVIYDDVSYIKKGWINRNNLHNNGEKSLFSIPLEGVSQNKKINEIHLKNDEHWWNKFSKNLEFNYSNSPYFAETLELYRKVESFPDRNLASFVGNSIIEVRNHLGLSTEILFSSKIDIQPGLSGESRIIEICKKLDAKTYINPINGETLYDRSHFNDADLEIFFINLKRDIIFNSFDPYLCTLEALMVNGKNKFASHIVDYDFV